LAGPEALQNIWDANIFYPYPTTLAFSEHLLGSAVVLLPVVLLGAPIAGTNAGVLLTTALTGWGTYLLVVWLTRNRWAGIVAGVAFAIAPYRLGHMTQLHLISTHWLPFICLAMARLIKHNRNRDLLLLILFTNLQFFSVINYAPLIALAVAIWSLPFFYFYRRTLSLSLLGRLGLFAAVTLALNLPVLRLYQQVSQQMGVVRTLGDAKVYGAYLVNYILPMGNSLLYGRWLGLPTHIDYQFPGVGIFISTFPGVIVILLTLAALLLSFRLDKLLRLVVWALFLLALVGFALSFGANDNAFGPAAAPLVAKLLPYPYLYDWLPILQGLRVPIRFALLTVFGLALLAGIGFAALSRRFLPSGRPVMITALALTAVLVIEHLPAPLPGVSVQGWGREQTWLRENIPANPALIELPYLLHTARSKEELLRVYHSSAHFRPLVNGTSGFKPTWLKELGYQLETFPDGRAFEALRRLGVGTIVLHQNEYEPAAWANITALLPAYLPSIEAMHTVDNLLVLQLKPSVCPADPAAVQVDAATYPTLTLTNTGPAAWVADPRRPGQLTMGYTHSDLPEPLFILPGQTVDLPLPAQVEASWQLDSANLGRVIKQDTRPAPLPPAIDPAAWQPVQVQFVNQAALQSMAVSTNPHLCGLLDAQLRWKFEEYAGEKVRLELVDAFGRVAVSSEVMPVIEAGEAITTHRLPLAETLPPGQYQLRVRFLTPAGDDIPAVSQEGAVITQPLALPIVIRPNPQRRPAAPAEPVALANNAALVGVDGPQATVQPGDWLRFTLYWQAAQPVSGDFTVFTQLLGPDGRVVAQHDNPPAGGWYPTSLWAAGETVADDYALSIDPAAPPGDYRLIVGMYNPTTGERVTTAGGADFIEVGTVTVGQ
jgi:hypothetical protein